MNATNLARMIPHQIHGPSGIVNDILAHSPIGNMFSGVYDYFYPPAASTPTTPTATGTTPASTFGTEAGKGVANALTWLAILGGAYLIFKSEITRK
jgi:hypothetical protein